MGPCDRYILVNGEPVQEPDLLTWGRWLEENHEAKRVGTTDVDGVRVSTVFLGMDHNLCFDSDDLENYRPVLWESMVFGGALDEEQWRYDSLEKAKRGHECLVRLAKLTNTWWGHFYFLKLKPFYEDHIKPYLEMI